MRNRTIIIQYIYSSPSYVKTNFSSSLSKYKKKGTLAVGTFSFRLLQKMNVFTLYEVLILYHIFFILILRQICGLPLELLLLQH